MSIALGLFALAGVNMLGGIINAKAQRTAGMLDRMQAKGQSFQLQGQANTLDFQARLLQIAGRINLDRERDRIMLERGEQHAAVAASGIEMSGSALQVLGRTAAQQELDLIMLRFGLESKVETMGFEADNMRLQAGIVTKTGRVANGLRRTGIATGLLGNFANSMTPLIQAKIQNVI